MKTDTLSVLYEKAFKLFSIDPSLKTEYGLFADRTRKTRLLDSHTIRVGDTWSNGDFIYLLPDANASSGSENGQRQEPFEAGEEDQVDLDLVKLDGKIHRERDEQL